MIFWRLGFALLLLEIFVLAVVVGEIGFFATLGLWAVTALAGTWLLQEQGIAVMKRAQAAFESGGLAVGEIFEGFFVFAAGALLIMPGFVSDIIALALLVPSVRNIVRARAGKSFGVREENFRPADDGVIEGVYERVPERNEQIQQKTPEN